MELSAWDIFPASGKTLATRTSFLRINLLKLRNLYWVMAMGWNAIGGIIGVLVGWMLGLLTRHFEEVWFGARLKIECHGIPGNKDETENDIYIKFRIQNSTERRVAKNCRAYLVEVRKISNGKVVSENLVSDTYQLSWPGFSLEPRDIPAKVKQYVDLVHFSKHSSGWRFGTKPSLSPSLAPLAEHRGTYRFTVVVAGDGAEPQEAQVDVDYNGDWKSATAYQ